MQLSSGNMPETKNSAVGSCDNSNDPDDMKIPEIEIEPHLLISKVRKQYLDYIIQLLSKNCGIKTDEKRIPSSIWRCARKVEIEAVKMCMVVSLYRKSILKIINRIKHETSKGKIYGDMKTFLKAIPLCDKRTQTEDEQCTSCLSTRKRSYSTADAKENQNTNNIISNSTNEPPMNKITKLSSEYTNHTNGTDVKTAQINGVRNRISSESTTCHSADFGPAADDQIFKDMEELFKSDDKEEDIFNENFNDRQFRLVMDEIRGFGGGIHTPNTPTTPMTPILHLAPVSDKTLDERLAELVLPQVKAEQKPVEKAQKIVIVRSKWMCELYFRRKKLCETLDTISEENPRRLPKIRANFVDIFGVDSDDELAPQSPHNDDDPEFIYSCKERIAPWIVHNLMPHYLKRKIKSKVLFKGVAKYILKLLIEGQRYPSEYEVKYFINEYLKYHPIIRCESDYY